MNVNGRLVHYFDFGNDALTGGISGILPYSRMKTSPGDSYAKGKLRALGLHKDHFPELEQLNPEFIQRLIGYMTERAKSFATKQLQEERVNALGKFAERIAQEWNNSAVAVNRIITILRTRLNQNYELTQKLLSNEIKHDQLGMIRRLILEKRKPNLRSIILSTRKLLEKEDEITDRL